MARDPEDQRRHVSDPLPFGFDAEDGYLIAPQFPTVYEQDAADPVFLVDRYGHPLLFSRRQRRPLGFQPPC